jgi:tetratricopeptide (TPR) repeat protein
MKNIRFTLAAAFLAAVWATAAMADTNSAPAKPRIPLGNNPHPIIWGGQPSRPAQPVPQPRPSWPVEHNNHHGQHHGFSRTYYVSTYWPNVASYWGNYPYAYAYPYLYAYQPRWLPAEGVLGPQAGFMDGMPLERGNDVAPEPKKAVARATNARANALAWRFIGFGDAQFAQQKYSEANGRYRKAAESAPQLADVWFRQALALSATGRYDQAVAAIKRGLRIDPNWPNSGFDLKKLYGADQRAAEVNLDALALNAEANPNDANLLFLVGVHLHFNGQPQRAEKFFQRAEELAGDDSEHITAFLKKPL